MKKSFLLSVLLLWSFAAGADIADIVKRVAGRTVTSVYVVPPGESIEIKMSVQADCFFKYSLGTFKLITEIQTANDNKKVYNLYPMYTLDKDRCDGVAHHSDYQQSWSNNDEIDHFLIFNTPEEVQLEIVK